MEKNYRQIIREGLSKRIAINPRYSLRAYSRDIGISFAQLSLFLNGKKGISPKKAALIFSVLGLNEDECKFYLLQVSKEFSRSLKKREHANHELSKLDSQSSFRLTQDAFQVIGEWYHFAILQVFSLKSMKDLKTENAQISLIIRSLNLKRIEVECAIDRLKRLELLESDGNRLGIVHETVFTSEGVPSEAIRSFHAQVLKKAADSIQMQNLNERHVSTVMLPVLKKDVPRIKKEVSKFQDRIMNDYGRAVQGDGDQVYALAQQLFKISEEI